MVSPIPSTLDNTSPASSQLASAGRADPSEKPATTTGVEAKNAASDGVVIDLSAPARALLASQTAATKSFTQVTADARTTIDTGYAQMKAAGRPFDFAHATDADWDRVFGSLDRRSLYAVASNSEGKFSENEQKVAQSIMSEQQGKAMGLYQTPPLSFTDAPASFKAGIAFMDGVSAEEKASAQWMYQRAALQWSYEVTSPDRGQTPDNLDSGNPVVRMLVKAFHSLKNQPVRPMSIGTYIKDLKELPLFDNGYFARELQDATRQLQELQSRQPTS
jgi:hypothetical protein